MTNTTNAIMKNFSSKKVWMTGRNQSHLDPPLITLIKENHDGKSDKDSLKPKLRRGHKLYTLDLYEFKISLFENGKPEDFFCSLVSST